MSALELYERIIEELPQTSRPRPEQYLLDVLHEQASAIAGLQSDVAEESMCSVTQDECMHKMLLDNQDLTRTVQSLLERIRALEAAVLGDSK